MPRRLHTWKVRSRELALGERTLIMLDSRNRNRKSTTQIAAVVSEVRPLPLGGYGFDTYA